MNACIMEIYEINGHITVILLGIPLICCVVNSVRKKRIEWLMTTTTEKMTNDIDSLN